MADEAIDSHKANDGCRPDQLFGVWAIEETHGRRLEALAVAADLEKLRAESMAAAERNADQPLYQLRSDGIAVIEISGPMTKYPTSFQALFGGTATLRTRQALRTAARDDQVNGIMLVVDSPGGTVAGSSDLADEIRKADARKPVYAYAEDLAASAGLLALAQGRKVFANANAEIGSIGVYLVVEDTSQRFAQAGVKVHVISSAPPIKGAGVHGAEVTPPQIAEWERRVKDLADLFATEVATGRRMEKQKAAALATGQVWVAEKAKEIGLIDDVVSLEEAMQRLRSEAMNEKDVKAAAAEAQERAAQAEKDLAETKAQLAASQKENEDLKARLAAAEKAKTEEADPLASLDLAARAMVEKAQKDAADAQAAVERMRAEQRAKEFAAKAAGFKALPVEAEAFGELLQEAADKLSPEASAELDRVLKAADASLLTVDASKRPVFGEKGATGAVAGGTAADQVEARAKALLADGKAKDIHQARDMAWKENPALYKQHMKERRAS